jgi:D-threo-aldose 1-dehydrogenase
MKTRQLGRTGPELSILGFGAASIGNLYTPIDEDTAHAAVDAAWHGGVRYYDTAPHYGLGLSERRLGAALAQRPRDEYLISTKVGRLLVPNPDPTGSDLSNGGFAVADDLTRARDYSRDGVHRSIDASLSRLGLDRLDIVYVHDPEDHMPAAIDEAIPALTDLRDQGVISAVGAGMNLVTPLRRLVAQTDLDVVMIAGRWTLLDRDAEPLLADCAEHAVSVVAAAPFNSGVLARPWPPNDAHFDYGAASAVVLEQARDLARICQRYGDTLPHAAMQFPLRADSVACVVAGIRTPAQAIANIEWATSPITDELWTALDERNTPS